MSNDELILEFMGEEMVPHCARLLLFDSSWDWLMLVVEKI